MGGSRDAESVATLISDASVSNGIRWNEKKRSSGKRVGKFNAQRLQNRQLSKRILPFVLFFTFYVVTSIEQEQLSESARKFMTMLAFKKKVLQENMVSHERG